MAKDLTLLVIVIALFVRCSPSAEEKARLATLKKEQSIKDSITTEKNKAEAKLILDIESGKVLKDTIGLSKSPVKITTSKIVKREYSNYNDIHLSYKNISKKPIAAIKFRWKGIDAFGDPAEMGGYTDGTGGGFADELLGPGKSSSGTWEILSRNAKKVTIAWPIEIVFSDGSKWYINNN